MKNYAILDMKNNQILNMVVENIETVEVVNPIKGRLIMDDTTGIDQLKYYNGSAWVTMGGYTLPVAGTMLGGVKSGTDISVDASGNVSVLDNSHNHTMSNVTGLDTALQGKSNTDHNHTLASLSEKNYASLDNKPTSFPPSSHGHLISEITNLQTALDSKINISAIGAINGVAPLGNDQKVPSAYLPGYVDDVLEYANLASFPATGTTGILYVALDTNKVYRWSGTVYTEVAASLALGETSATAYRGDRGKAAYDHSLTTGNPHSTTPADIGAMATTHAANSITGFGSSTNAVATSGSGGSSTLVSRQDHVHAHGSHTGDVTSSGMVTTIASNVVTNAKLAQVATSIIKGRATTGTGNVEDLTPTQVRTILNIADGANNYVHPTGDGYQHIPITGTSNFGKVLMAGSTAGSAAWTDVESLPTLLEAVQDIMGSSFANSDSVTFYYNDSSNTVQATVETDEARGLSVQGTGVGLNVGAEFTFGSGNLILQDPYKTQYNRYLAQINTNDATIQIFNTATVGGENSSLTTRDITISEMTVVNGQFVYEICFADIKIINHTLPASSGYQISFYNTGATSGTPKYFELLVERPYCGRTTL